MTAEDNMGWIVKGRFRAYYASSYLVGLMISLYFTYTRALIGGMVDEEKYSIVIFLGAMESVPGLLSVVFGLASDYAGRRKALLGGLIAALFLLAMPWVDVRHYPIVALGVFSSYNLFWASLFGIILDYTGGRGKPLSLFGLAGSLGWSSGGLVVGVLAPYGPHVVFGTAAFSIALASIVAYLTFPRGRVGLERPTPKQLVSGLKAVMVLFIAYLIGSAGVSIYIDSLGVRLYELLEGNMIVYGIVFSTLTGLLGAASRPVAGMMVDRFPSELVLAGVFATYMASSLIMIAGPPLALLITVWLLPLYPFYETSALTTTSRRLPPSLQATAAGIVSTGTSMSGFIKLVASDIVGSGGFERALTLGVLLLLASLVLIVASRVRRDGGK